MIFEIDFNQKTDDKLLIELGAKVVKHYEEFNQMVIEINSFEELQELVSKVENIEKTYYSAIISFDPPCIYLDNDR